MKKVALIGAFDRYNYGDLLFPILLEKYMTNKIKDVSIEYYGLVKSDLSSFGGKPTKSYKKLLKDVSFDSLIFVGGELLGATWNGMYYCLLKNKFQRLLFRFIRKIIGSNSMDKLCNKLLINKKNILLPWVINPDVVKGKSVIYNAVGGSSVHLLSSSYLEYIKNSMERFSYVSVRDKETVNELKQLKIKSDDLQLVPDSAIVMSEIFSKQELPIHFSKENRNTLNSFNGKFIVFQINKILGEKYIDQLLIQIKKVYKMTKYPIVLLPIGTAAGHEDHVPLKEIHSQLPFETVYIDIKNVYETMGFIAWSKMYIGTSLHGAITALSYGVPHIGLTKDVPKLEAFLKTWDIDGYSRCLSVNELSENILNRLDDNKHLLMKQREFLIKLGMHNLDEILSLI